MRRWSETYQTTVCNSDLLHVVPAFRHGLGVTFLSVFYLPLLLNHPLEHDILEIFRKIPVVFGILLCLPPSFTEISHHLGILCTSAHYHRNDDELYIQQSQENTDIELEPQRN